MAYDLHCQIDEATDNCCGDLVKDDRIDIPDREMRGGPPLAQRGLREQQAKSAEC